MLQGDLKTAETYLKKSIPEYEKIGDKDGVARATIDLGELALDQGNLPVAEKRYRQAIDLATEINDKNARAYALAGLGSLLTEQDHLSGARETYRQALDLAKSTADTHLEQDVKIKLARVDLEEGRTHELMPTLRQLKEQCSADHNPDGVLATGILLSRALLEESHDGELAQKELEALQPFVQQDQNHLLKQEWALAVARAQFASGQSEQAEQAKRGIDQVLLEANSHGYVALGLKAKLARLERSQSLGHSNAEEIKEVERAARTKGLALLARHAALCAENEVQRS
jgi:tetratricopeptide (TPR) repeat protein